MCKDDTIAGSTSTIRIPAAVKLFALLSIVMLGSRTCVADTPANPVDKPGWELTFDDEFSSGGLDRSKWNDQFWYGRTHGRELGYYSADGVRVGEGSLTLITQNRSEDGDVHPFCTGMVESYPAFLQKYGWFEARARVARGIGYNSAVWMLGRHSPPEIDLFEIYGNNSHMVWTTHHWHTEEKRHQAAGIHFPIDDDLSQNFHTYAVDWEPDSLTWYVDGVERYRVTDHIPDEPMYVLATIAIAERYQHPTRDTLVPSQMDIDYIRVYKKR